MIWPVKKPILKKVLESAKNVSNTYIPPKIKLISNEPIDFINEKNKKSNLTMIKQEAKIFGMLYFGSGTAISRYPLLYIMVCRRIQVAYL